MSLDQLRRSFGWSLSEWARLCALVVVLNGPYWAFSFSTFISRGFISLDGLLVAILLRNNLRWMVTAVWLSWIIDGVVSSATTYRFASPIDLLRSVAFESEINWAAFASWSLFLALLPFLVATLVFMKGKLQAVRPELSLVALGAIVVLDALNGSSMLSRRDVRLVPFNIAGSAAASIANALLDSGRVESLVQVRLGGGGIREVSDTVQRVVRDRRTVVYAIVESMGIPVSMPLREHLTQRLLTAGVRERYDGRVQRVVAIGGTTAGELRRFCGLEGSFRKVTTADGKSCLPTILRDQGWHTTGVHGFSKGMFLRKNWWPFIGLGQMEFSEELFKKYPDRCGGAFRGICDRDAIHEAFQLAQQSQSFSYVLTLNSHLPLDDMYVPRDLADLCLRERVSSAVCSMMAHLDVTLDAVSTEALAAIDAPVIIVVGDHPPPFLDTGSRKQFVGSEVPMYILEPKRPRRDGLDQARTQSP